MIYNIKSHVTIYNGIEFRSRLEARWAAFFDLIADSGLVWEYEPIDLDGWTPDFRITWPCGHSECPPTHSILIEVKPYYSIKEFDGHPCTQYPFGTKYDEKGYATEVKIPADASASFGINPFVTEWDMAHGAGGGTDTLEMWFGCRFDFKYLWEIAGNVTRYKLKN
jgi:hypothetical protein